jgi:hypothetical protein
MLTTANRTHPYRTAARQMRRTRAVIGAPNACKSLALPFSLAVSAAGDVCPLMPSTSVRVVVIT